MVVYYELHDNEWLKMLFDERHSWVLIYIRDTFWAGKSTKQRNENMNSFFLRTCKFKDNIEAIC